MKLVDILQRIPKGTKIWSPVYGDCELDLVFSCDIAGKPIWINYGANLTCSANLGANGEICENVEGSECVIFPSRENRDWVKFARTFIEVDTKVMVSDGKMWVYGVCIGEGKVQTKFEDEDKGILEPKFIVPFDLFDPFDMETTMKNAR